MVVKIFDYDGNSYDINVDKIEFPINVSIISGDEILKINGKIYDASDFSKDPRIVGYKDGNYDINEDQFYEWNNRDSSYPSKWVSLDFGTVLSDLIGMAGKF